MATADTTSMTMTMKKTKQTSREQSERGSPRRTRGNNVRGAWVEHLKSIPWETFVVLTFYNDGPAAMAMAEFRKWIRRLHRIGHGRVEYFVATERGPATVRVHLHALLRGTAAMTGEQMERVWYAGKAKTIVPFTPDVGGEAYVTKAIEVAERDGNDYELWARPVAARPMADAA